MLTMRPLVESLLTSNVLNAQEVLILVIVVLVTIFHSDVPFVTTLFAVFSQFAARKY